MIFEPEKGSAARKARVHRASRTGAIHPRGTEVFAGFIMASGAIAAGHGLLCRPYNDRGWKGGR